MAYTFNPFSGQFDNKGSGNKIPQYENADKPSPVAGDMWVKRTVVLDGEAGSPRGLLLSLTYTGDGVSTYELAFQTEEATTVRVPMS